MIVWIYDKFLWFWGFHREEDPPIVGRERITYMLRRQKKRFGWLWWPWALAWIAFPVWLFLHILQLGGF